MSVGLAESVGLVARVVLAVLVVPVESEGLEESVGQAGLEELAELVAPVELEAQVGSAESVALAAGMGRLRYRRVALVGAAAGSTIRNTAAARHIVTAPRPTGLAVPRAATRSRIARIRLGNRSVARAATWPATEMAPELATEAVLE